MMSLWTGAPNREGERETLVLCPTCRIRFFADGGLDKLSGENLEPADADATCEMCPEES